jgi:2-polyprenyl-6-hydroxyphenyl methylase/3-demethylubiquinone-9 3-methyltransferase
LISKKEKYMDKKRKEDNMSPELDLWGLEEPAKYDRMVEIHSNNAWWDPTGPLGGLHLLNQFRFPYFEQALGGYSGKCILDIGCGGGIFAESAARAGAQVVAIDPSKRSIEAAEEHARQQGLAIDYRFAYAEKFNTDEQFDAVFAVDVLEHVEDLDATLDTCARVLKPGGLFGFLTHNQTLEAFTFLIWQGEYNLGFIPQGIHDFHKFIRPEDLNERLTKRGLQTVEVRGLEFLLNTEPPRVDFAPTPTISYIGYSFKR